MSSEPSFGIPELGEEREWGPKGSQERKAGDWRRVSGRGVVCRAAQVGVWGTAMIGGGRV